MTLIASICITMLLDLNAIKLLKKRVSMETIRIFTICLSSSINNHSYVLFYNKILKLIMRVYLIIMENIFRIFGRKQRIDFKVRLLLKSPVRKFLLQLNFVISVRMKIMQIINKIDGFVAC